MKFLPTAIPSFCYVSRQCLLSLCILQKLHSNLFFRHGEKFRLTEIHHKTLLSQILQSIWYNFVIGPFSILRYCDWNADIHDFSWTLLKKRNVNRDLPRLSDIYCYFERSSYRILLFPNRNFPCALSKI